MSLEVTEGNFILPTLEKSISGDPAREPSATTTDPDGIAIVIEPLALTSSAYACLKMVQIAFDASSLLEYTSTCHSVAPENEVLQNGISGVARLLRAHLASIS